MDYFIVMIKEIISLDLLKLLKTDLLLITVNNITYIIIVYINGA